MDEEKDNLILTSSDPDVLDLSFTSTSTSTTSTTNTTTSSSSARSSLARSSLTVSFNDRLSTSSSSSSATTTTTNSSTSLHHRLSDPHWAAIRAATSLSSSPALNLGHLKLLRILGSGDLGRVFLCRLRDSDPASLNTLFALKVVDTRSLSPKKLAHARTEAEILSFLDHPFLPTLYAHINVSHYSCLLIDYCPGGDLHSLLRKQPHNRLPVQAVRFFAAEVLVALEYLHALGIVYRDLKPENILLREDGHIMMSDFDLCFRADVASSFQSKVKAVPAGAKRDGRCFGAVGCRAGEIVAEFRAEPTTAFSRSCVGTHEYLAPELVTGNGHGNGVDWWAFGVLMYELLYGVTPFKGGSKESTLRNIASGRQVRFPAGAEGEEEERGMREARDLIDRLLVKDPRKRLGCAGGATDIKRHPFFSGLKWPLIRCYRPPEVRGVMRKSTSPATHHVATMVRHKRRRWWWRGLENLFAKKNRGSKYYARSLNHSNSNYYRYSVKNNVRRSD